MHENGKSRSPVENFCLTVRNNFLGTTSKVQNVWFLGNFFAYHGFPSIFLSHSSEKLREEPSNYSESFKWQVSKNLIKRNGISPLSVEIFCLRVPIIFVEEHFFISEKFGYRKISCLRGWYHLSPLNLCHIYCLQKWLGNPSVIQDFWDIENFSAQ